MTKTRDNHYVPQWYQKGFLNEPKDFLLYLDLQPNEIQLPNGDVKFDRRPFLKPVSKCFYQTDLYTTFFGEFINDEIERLLFGQIDNTGSKAVRAFITDDPNEWHKNFQEFFAYIDSQKIRTPKGLDWIHQHYPVLSQNELMMEMQAIRNKHCTMWTEGVREIVFASESSIKFILSDHPVTVYNYALPPDRPECGYPNDPNIQLKASQTIFPLDKNHCIIFTNYEYAIEPDISSPLEKRTFARNYRQSLVRTDAFIRTRFLNAEEVTTVNHIIKARARRYVAAAEKEWLYPEKHINGDWQDLREVLLPRDELYRFGGQTFVGYEDGTTHYQDAFGRTEPHNPYLSKDIPQNLGPNDACGCGSGRKYKKCCRDKPENKRPSWKQLSIRERNLSFLRAIKDIFGLNKGKTWEDIRRDLSEEQIKKLYEIYWFFWPRDTDIFDLLPKPDGCLRTVYTGIIDPRTISHFATNSVLYFDEVIIQSPFIHPRSVRPEFSPIESPHQYKEQTLKNMILMLVLEPYIDAGYVNFIPDPCSFDSHMQTQMMHMAQSRSDGNELNERDINLLKSLSESDFKRSIITQPKERQIQMLRKSLPDLSDEQIDSTLQYIEGQRLADPFALLQDDVYGTGSGNGQLHMTHLSPNFEITLFLAQITGSFIITDSSHRWDELKAACTRETDWSELINHLENLEYPFNINPLYVVQRRIDGRLGNMRQTFREIYSSILKEADSKAVELFTTSIKNSLDKSLGLAKKELSKEKELNEASIHAEPWQSFMCKIDCLVPKGGITHNNVQRLLLSYDSNLHMQNVPMAIFLASHEKDLNEK
jgi:hypothetical protein